MENNSHFFFLENFPRRLIAKFLKIKFALVPKPSFNNKMDSGEILISALSFSWEITLKTKDKISPLPSKPWGTPATKEIFLEIGERIGSSGQKRKIEFSFEILIN